MGRRNRIWVPGACYHITNRGNHRNDIFRDESDFGVYLLIVKESLQYYKEYEYKLCCYCLMTNHVHLMIKTKDKDLRFLMQRINSSYARYFNKKYNYVGHLFQARYYSELIQDDKQLLSTSRYIHLNPSRARMVNIPEEYKWSSYPVLIGETDESITNSELILRYFKYKDRHKLYKEFVEKKLINIEDEEEENIGISS